MFAYSDEEANARWAKRLSQEEHKIKRLQESDDLPKSPTGGIESIPAGWASPSVPVQRVSPMSDVLSGISTGGGGGAAVGGAGSTILPAAIHSRAARSPSPQQPSVAAASVRALPHRSGTHGPPLGVLHGGASTVVSLRDELENMVNDRFRMLLGDLRTEVAQEWSSRLPTLEYGIKEKHQELRDLFDRNNKTALSIGDKVLEVGGDVEILKREQQVTEGWRKELDACLRRVADDVSRLGDADALTVRRQGELQKSQEEVLHRVREVEQLRGDHRSIESRLEAHVREEARAAERRGELRAEGIDARVARVEAEAGQAQGAQRGVLARVAAAEQAHEATLAEVQRLREQLLEQVGECDAYCEEVENLRSQLAAVTSATAPGYCQGCRLVTQDVENKLFTIKQSIVFLDETVKGQAAAGGGGGGGGGAGAAVARAPSSLVGGVSSPLARGGSADLDSAGLQLLHRRVDEMRTELELLHETQQARDEASEVPAAVRRYVDDAVAAAEHSVLEQVKESIDMWAEDRARQTDVDTLAATLSDVLRRLSNVEDKLDD